jgi:alanyl-tRNA synthetase
MTEEEIDKVQCLVNEKIRHNLPVYDQDVPYKQAIEEGAIALFDEKYGDIVRVLKIGRPAISSELCGGTHVAATGEIGFFQILSESSIGGGLRRIEAVTGRGAEEAVKQRFSSLEKIAHSLDALPESVQDKVFNLVAELEREHKQSQALEKELARREAEALLGQAVVVKGVTLVVAKVRSSRLAILREMADLLRDKLRSAVIVLGTVYDNKPAMIAAVTPDLLIAGYDARSIAKELAKVIGGGGGGKPTLAQAGGQYKDKLDEALRLVKSLI